MFESNSLLLSSPPASSGPVSLVPKRSVRFDSVSNPVMEFAPLGDGDQTKWSFYTEFKPSGKEPVEFAALFGARVDASLNTFMGLNIDGNFEFVNGTANSTGYVTETFLSDTSRFYQILLQVDTSLPEPEDRVRLFVDGVLQVWGLALGLAEGALTAVGSGSAVYRFGDSPSISGFKSSGIFGRLIYADGVIIPLSSIGSYDQDDVWKIVPYAGPLGVNGVHLDFSDWSSLAALGNSRVAITNINLTPGVDCDVTYDVPEPGTSQGNFCTLNPRDNPNIGLDLSDCNSAVESSTGTWKFIRGTHGVQTGTFQFEIEVLSGELPDFGVAVGVSRAKVSAAYLQSYSSSNDLYLIQSDSLMFRGGNFINTGIQWGAGTTITIIIQATSRSVYYCIDGVFVDAIEYTVPGDDPLIPIIGVRGFNVKVHANFGQQDFMYTQEPEYVGIHSGSIPAPVTKNPRDLMEIVQRSGTAETRQQISGLRVAPGLLITKNISGPLDSIAFLESGGGEPLSSATQLDGTGGNLFSFNSNGYTLRDGSSSNFLVKNAGSNYFDFMFKESLASGMISKDFTMPAGSSPVGIDHQFGTRLAAVLLRPKNASWGFPGWAIWVDGMADMGDVIDTTGTYQYVPGFWGQTKPDSANFYVTPGITAPEGTEMVAIMFTEVPGFSRFGLYSPHSTMPFVQCGFKPRLIMTRTVYAPGPLRILDTDRPGDDDMYISHSLDGASYQLFEGVFAPTSTGFHTTSADGFANTEADGPLLFMAFAGTNHRAPFGVRKVQPVITNTSPVAVILGDSFNDPEGLFAPPRPVESGPAGWEMRHHPSVNSTARNAMWMDGLGNMNTQFYNVLQYCGGFSMSAPSDPETGEYSNRLPVTAHDYTLTFRTGEFFRFTSDTNVVVISLSVEDVSTSYSATYTARLMHNESDGVTQVHLSDSNFGTIIQNVPPVTVETEYVFTFRLNGDNREVLLNGVSLWSVSALETGLGNVYPVTYVSVGVHNSTIRDFSVT